MAPGPKPKDIAPLIYEASKRKNWKVRETLKGNAWILKIKHDTAISVNHISEFFNLWMLVHDFHLDEQAEDDIIWKHATASTAYKAQFLGLTLSPMDHMVWKAWAPPKVKFFAWLALQDRIWTADRLEKRDWPNCGPCRFDKENKKRGYTSLSSVATHLGSGDQSSRSLGSRTWTPPIGS